MESMHFIYDANGDLFGNPKGYRRFQDAQRICTQKCHKLWEIYDKRQRTESNKIWNIKLQPAGLCLGEEGLLIPKKLRLNFE